jgi:hypothetical protein
MMAMMRACVALALLLILAASGDGRAGAATATPPAGADFSQPAPDVALPQTGSVVVTSVTLRLPGPGVVIVNSAGYVFFNSGAGFGCSIDRRTSFAPGVPEFGGSGDANNSATLAGTRGFREATGGIKTHNLICVGGNVTAKDAVLTAIYVPERY